MSRLLSWLSSVPRWVRHGSSFPEADNLAIETHVAEINVIYAVIEAYKINRNSLDNKFLVKNIFPLCFTQKTSHLFHSILYFLIIFLFFLKCISTEPYRSQLLFSCRNTSGKIPFVGKTHFFHHTGSLIPKSSSNI